MEKVGEKVIMLVLLSTAMTDEQICEMVNRHRYLIRCEIKHALDKVCAENGNQDYSAANRSEAFNDTKWIEFAKWFKEMRDKE